MYKINTSNKFEKDFFKCAKRDYDMEALGEVVGILEISGKLPRKYKPHLLTGNLKDIWNAT